MYSWTAIEKYLLVVGTNKISADNSSSTRTENVEFTSTRASRVHVYGLLGLQAKQKFPFKKK